MKRLNEGIEYMLCAPHESTDRFQGIVDERVEFQFSLPSHVAYRVFMHAMLINSRSVSVLMYCIHLVIPIAAKSCFLCKLALADPCGSCVRG